MANLVRARRDGTGRIFITKYFEPRREWQKATPEAARSISIG